MGYLKFACSTGASQEIVFQTWDHFLKDRRHANPSLVLQEYYGEKADPLSSLLTVGHLRPWWLGVVKDIQASPLEAYVVQ